MTTANKHPTYNIILCGFMGTGKTTVAQLIATRLGWRFADTDHVIELRQGRSVREIFAEEGEAFFRRQESALCLELGTWRRTVIATGGGIVLSPDNRAALERAGMVICLEAPPEELVLRLSRTLPDRPLLAGAVDPAQRIRELLAERAAAYAAVPYHIDTAGCTPRAVADAALELWNQTRQHQ